MLQMLIFPDASCLVGGRASGLQSIRQIVREELDKSEDDEEETEGEVTFCLHPDPHVFQELNNFRMCTLPILGLSPESGFFQKTRKTLHEIAIVHLTLSSSFF